MNRLSHAGEDAPAQQAIGTTPDVRLRSLRRLLEAKPILRVLECHNGLSALIVEDTRVERDGVVCEFDALWSSSLTDSTAKGKPDIEAVDISARLQTVNEIFEVTTKPMIFDADTGREPQHLAFTVRSLERLGVSAVIVEDKAGLKKNSLLGTTTLQQQEDVETFCFKISQAKQAQITDDFMFIARIESLILEKGLDDALSRAEAYIDAGADAIMIHSRKGEPDEVLAFCKQYQGFRRVVPLVAVPSSYSRITERELADAGVNIVIYANHLLRAAYPAMKKAAEMILTHQRGYDCEQDCLPIQDILTLIPGTT